MNEREAARPEKLNRKDHQVEAGVGKICQVPNSVKRERERERVSLPSIFFPISSIVSFRTYRPIHRRILSIVCQNETGIRPSETEQPRARANFSKRERSRGRALKMKTFRWRYDSI